MTTPNFAALLTYKTTKSLPTLVKGEGNGILGACIAARSKVPAGAEIIETEMKRVMFLRGGFRVYVPVAKRTLRKYTTEASNFITPFNLRVQ